MMDEQPIGAVERLGVAVREWKRAMREEFVRIIRWLRLLR